MKQYLVMLLLLVGSGRLAAGARIPIHDQLAAFTKAFPYSQRERLSNDQEGRETKRALVGMIKDVGDHFGLRVKRYYRDSQGSLARANTLTYKPRDAYPRLVTGKRMGESVHNLSADFFNLCFAANLLSMNMREELISAQDRQVLDALVAHYKVHLMPYKHQIPIILYGFLRLLQCDEYLRANISDFKFNVSQPEQSNPDGTRPNVPTIVIYPAAGAKAAQYVLDAIYGLFGGVQGTGELPRWNQQVTSLIAYAQGDGDYKGKEQYKALYEDGDEGGNGRVHYRSDITGIDADYYLEQPE